MDSTRALYLERQIDRTNNNTILRHISRSLRYFYAEEYREALTEIDKAIAINPNIALAYARRGSIYYRLGDFQRATMNWNIALKLDPEFTEIHDLLHTFSATGFDKSDEDQMMGEIAAKRQSWRYSKLSGLRFLEYLCKSNVDADKAVKELYLFGGSASDHSSIYYKYS